MRTLVIGDIHGGYKAMMQVLERANFNLQEDTLIGLGDYADGWPEVFETIEYLRNLPNFISVLGNHDDWLLDYLTAGNTPFIWTSQGGTVSIKSYAGVSQELKEAHREFLQSFPYYYITNDKLFIHGGPTPVENGVRIDLISGYDMMWSRELFKDVAYSVFYNKDIGIKTDPFKEIYIGHTTTQMVQPDFTPVSKYGIYMLDQGAGWNGKLTVMDIDTKEYWQSDLVPTLYPEIKGRK
jgi:serine/threonine protein phosphatase 1